MKVYNSTFMPAKQLFEFIFKPAKISRTGEQRERENIHKTISTSKMELSHSQTEVREIMIPCK